MSLSHYCDDNAKGSVLFKLNFNLQRNYADSGFFNRAKLYKYTYCAYKKASHLIYGFSICKSEDG